MGRCPSSVGLGTLWNMVVPLQRPIRPLLGLAAALAQWGCGPDLPPATLDGFRQPTGVVTSADGRWLFVTNGNWNESEDGAAVLAYDLSRLAASIAAPRSAGSAYEARHPCRRGGDDGPIDCSASAALIRGTPAVLAAAVGNVVADQPAGASGPIRLLVTQRNPPAVAWIDAIADGDSIRLECGQDERHRCDEAHLIVEGTDRSDLAIPSDPARVVLDDQGYRLAYVPQLLGDTAGVGGIALIGLDGESGPELVDVETEFFAPDPFDGTDFTGGFSVASRPCDPEAAPRASRDCTRPFLYASQRFFPGARRFTVAPGLGQLLPGDESTLAEVNPDVVPSQPFMGDLAFEGDGSDPRLLLVQTTPGSLLRIDTSVGPDGDPLDAVIGVIPLCEDPNVLAVHRPALGEALALVSCYGDAGLAVIGLGAWRLIDILDVGAGADEIAIDSARQWAFVTNVLDDSVSVISLDVGRADYLTEIARIR